MMNILARILSHGFAIAVVVILAVGYIYRGELFPGMELPAYLYPATPAQTEAEATAGDVDREEPATAPSAPADAGAGPEIASEPDTGEPEAPLAETATEEPVPAPSAPADAGTGPEIASEPDTGEPEAPLAETATEEPVPAPSAPADAGAVPEIAIEPDTGEPEAPLAETATEEPVPAPSALVETPDESVQQEPSVAGDEVPVPQAAARAADTVSAGSAQAMVKEERSAPGPSADDSGAVSKTVESSTQPGETDRPYQLLAAAREAFWLHDYAEAEAKYRGLIALEPDNPDGYGELGNMYFTQGNWEQAAEAYYNAGINLLGTGRIQQAEMLVGVIRGLNGNQADALAELVATARESGAETR